MKIYKVILTIIFIVIVIAFLTKPSFSRFKQFGEDFHSPQYKTVFKKTGDYFLWATFERLTFKQGQYKKSNYTLVSTDRYAGYLLNFHKVK